MAASPLLQLEPSIRIIGTLFGQAASRRRGLSDDIVGSRTYLPGDDIRRIDWAGSARLSALSGQEQFLVRESYGEEAPTIVIACDRRPSMALYPERFPWLCKPLAMQRFSELVVKAAAHYHCPIAYLDQQHWQPPKMTGEFNEVTALSAEQQFSAREADGDALLLQLQQFEHQLPPGSFVFLLSDFNELPSTHAISTALDAEWDLIPVVLRDPTWEQSYPIEIAGLSVPVSDTNGELRFLRQSKAQANQRRQANEQLMSEIDHLFTSHGFPPLLLASAQDEAISESVIAWHERRLLL